MQSRNKHPYLAATIDEVGYPTSLQNTKIVNLKGHLLL